MDVRREALAVRSDPHHVPRREAGDLLRRHGYSVTDLRLVNMLPLTLRSAAARRTALGIGAPERVASLSMLTPSLAWRKRRGFVPIVKLLRPELAAVA